MLQFFYTKYYSYLLVYLHAQDPASCATACTGMGQDDQIVHQVFVPWHATFWHLVVGPLSADPQGREHHPSIRHCYYLKNVKVRH